MTKRRTASTGAYHSVSRRRIAWTTTVALAAVTLVVVASVLIPRQSRIRTLHDVASAWGLQTTTVPDLPRLEGAGGYARLRVTNDDGTSSWLVLLEDLPSGIGGFTGVVPVVAEFDQTVNLLRCGSPHEDQVPSAVASTLALWRGVTREKVFGMAKDLALLGDPAVAGLLIKSTGSAARALFHEQFGEDAYERLEVRLGIAGLHVGDSLPAFSASATDGTRVDNRSLSGHKAVLVAVAPDCGSCYDAAVQTLLEIDAVRADDWIITVVMSSGADTVRAGILRDALPASMKTVADPGLQLIRTLWMQDTPYVVLLGRDATVVYAGSCYDTAAVAAGVDSLTRLP